MKKRSLLLILVLTLSLATPIFIFQTQPVYTQPLFYINSHTYTFFPEPIPATPNNISINFTVTTDIGVLIEGNIAAWILGITAKSNSTVNITINSVYNGTIINRGMMFPSPDAFTSDIKFPLFPPNYTLSLMKYESVLLLPNTAGFPSLTSFSLSVTIESSDIISGSKTIYLTSDVPVVSLVLPNPNPSTPPTVIYYYLAVSISMALLLPITMILTNRWLKNRRLKKERVEGR